MSPEQLRSGEFDRRSDVFSTGGMRWSMLTGRKLFQADNDAATMSNIIHMDIPLPSTVGLKPPPVFDAICMRALQRDPADRFATAQEMEEALREAAATPAPAPTASPDETAKLYLDEAERLLAARRVEGAQELIARAKQVSVTDPALVVRRTDLAENVLDATLRNQEVRPSAIYYAIVRGARAGKSASAIAAELRAGHARGNL